MCQDTDLETFFVAVGAHSPFPAGVRDWIAAAVADAATIIPPHPNTRAPFTGEESE